MAIWPKGTLRGSDDLRANFIAAIGHACNGIQAAVLDADEKPDIALIRSVAESHLFNIFFILNCESREVFPMRSPEYRAISLSGVMDCLGTASAKGEPGSRTYEADLRAAFKGDFRYHGDGTDLYDRLLRLSLSVLDGAGKKDDFGFSIHGFRETVFAPEELRFVRSFRIANRWMVQILFALGFKQVVTGEKMEFRRIAYECFTGRDLGAIYEGFLEFKLRQSDDPGDKREKLTFSQDNGDRKASGSYYTPDAIGSDLIEELLKPLVKGKRAEDLLTLRICDPAMGSGHFLVCVLNLMSRLYLGKLARETSGRREVSLGEAKRLILDHCIFGVDIDSRAVKLARMSLWLECAHPGVRLSRLDDQLKYGDSLISEMKGYDLNFDWRAEFGARVEDAKFDVVVGNPPWGSTLSKEQKAYLKDTYPEIDSSTPNAFAYFLGLGLRRSRGPLGFVLPDSFLTKDFEKTRRLLAPALQAVYWFQNTGLPESLKAFPEVDHDVCAVLLTGRIRPEATLKVSRYDPRQARLIVRSLIRPKPDFIVPQYASVYNLRVQEDDIALRKKLAGLPTLSQLMKCHEGIHSGNCREAIFTSRQIRGDEKPMFLGAKSGDLIDDFYARRSGWFVDYRRDAVDRSRGMYATLGNEASFSRPKIYITRTGNPFYVFLDEATYASNNFFSMQFRDDTRNSLTELAVIASLIQSRFAQYWIRMHLAPRLGASFVETKITHLDKVPIPAVLIRGGSADPAFFKWIERIRALKAKYHERLDRFQKSVTLRHGPKQYPEKLRNFHLLAFSEFRSLLVRQNARLSPTQEERLRREFEVSKGYLLELEAEITRIKTGIDATVYQLMGLSKAEIEVVERYFEFTTESGKKKASSDPAA